MNKENKNGGIKNINNNKNIIYINLPKKVYRKPHHNKEQDEREFSNQSNLYPTLYRPIYNDISPNMNRPIPNDNKLIRDNDNVIKMGNSKEVVDVESNIDEIINDRAELEKEAIINTSEKDKPKKVIIRRGRPSKYLSVEERKKAVATRAKQKYDSDKSAVLYAKQVNDERLEEFARSQQPRNSVFDNLVPQQPFAKPYKIGRG